MRTIRWTIASTMPHPKSLLKGQEKKKCLKSSTLSMIRKRKRTKKTHWNTFTNQRFSSGQLTFDGQSKEEMLTNNFNRPHWISLYIVRKSISQHIPSKLDRENTIRKVKPNSAINLITVNKDITFRITCNSQVSAEKTRGNAISNRAHSDSHRNTTLGTWLKWQGTRPEMWKVPNPVLNRNKK